jgi:hypothetical protein
MMNEINLADEYQGDGSFIDINIDSDNDEQESNKLKQSSNKLADKFFNFNKYKSKQQNTNKQLEQLKLAAETSDASSSTSSCSTINSSCSLQPITVTNCVKSPLPQQSQSSISNSTKTLMTLNEATDMLLSNLNEINLTSYDDEDDLEDDDDDIGTNITSTTINNEKRNGFYDLKLNNDLKYDDFLKQKELFNSTLISSLQSISSYANNPSDLEVDNSKILDDLALTDISLNDNIPVIQNKSEPLFSNENDLILLDENNNSLVKTSRDKLSNSNNTKLPVFRANSIPPNQTSSNSSKPSLKLIKNLSHPVNGCRSDSLVEGLLGDIYDRFNVTLKESMDSDVFTELSSSRFSGCDSTADHDMETRYYSKFHKLAKPTLQTFSMIL